MGTGRKLEQDFLKLGTQGRDSSCTNPKALLLKAHF